MGQFAPFVIRGLFFSYKWPKFVSRSHALRHGKWHLTSETYLAVLGGKGRGVSRDSLRSKRSSNIGRAVLGNAEGARSTREGSEDREDRVARVPYSYTARNKLLKRLLCRLISRASRFSRGFFVCKETFSLISVNVC